MVRISGVVLPGNKKLFVSLTAIKGIGQSLARTICADVKIDPLTKTDDVTEQQEALLRTRIEKEVTEGELTRKVGLDVKRLQDIGTWRGMRHRKKLPVRGQTSRRNARTKRGKRKTGSSGRTTLTKT
jgi:small subunit ribosomal protein S13